MDKRDKRGIAFTPTADCNLRCSYCYVNKVNIENAENSIIESFNSDYYYDLCRYLYDDDDGVLTNISIWGGEPLYHIERIIPVTYKILEYYKDIDNIMFSSNFAMEDAIYKLFTLLYMLKEFLDRKFYIKFQISCDGDDDITSKTRGKNVVKNIKNNLEKLNSFYDEIPDNCIISINVKPTITIEKIRENMLDIDYQLNYYKFFDDLYTIICDNPGIKIRHPTTVGLGLGITTPYNYTKYDGELFAEFIKLQRSIELTNKEEHIYKYMKYLAINSDRCDSRLRHIFKNNIISPGIGSCGQFKFMTDLYPDDYVGGCHRLIDDYIKLKNGDTNISRLLIKKEKYKEMRSFICSMYDNKASTNLSSVVPVIQFLAISGDILSKYSDYDNAVAAARFILTIASGCLFENESASGSFSVPNIGIIKLWLNGAMDNLLQSR